MLLPFDDEPPSSSLEEGVASCHFLVASVTIGSYGEDSYMDISYLVQPQCYIHLRTYIKESLIVYIHLKTRLHPFFIYIGRRKIKSDEKYKIVKKSTKLYNKSTKMKEFGLDSPHCHPVAPKLVACIQAILV
jgi:hypothetical protein